MFRGERLLSFSFAGENAFGVGVRVKKASLWLRMGFRTNLARDFPHLLHPKPPTLYVFHVLGDFAAQEHPPLVLQPHVTTQPLFVVPLAFKYFM